MQLLPRLRISFPFRTRGGVSGPTAQSFNMVASMVSRDHLPFRFSGTIVPFLAQNRSYRLTLEPISGLHGVT